VCCSLDLFFVVFVCLDILGSESHKLGTRIYYTTRVNPTSSEMLSVEICSLSLYIFKHTLYLYLDVPLTILCIYCVQLYLLSISIDCVLVS